MLFSYQQVIRWLTKLFTQNTGTWAALCRSSCLCIHEVCFYSLTLAWFTSQTMGRARKDALVDVVVYWGLCCSINTIKRNIFSIKIILFSWFRYIISVLIMFSILIYSIIIYQCIVWSLSNILPPLTSQLVRTVVVLLHRQWLKTKGRESQTSCNRIWTGSGVQVLREALMFLHWLLLKDSSFSEHCLDVLHMYDQVIPAIRDTFRLIPDLSDSEGGTCRIYTIIITMTLTALARF